jgi:hypothetical protein
MRQWAICCTHDNAPCERSITRRPLTLQPPPPPSIRVRYLCTASVASSCVSKLPSATQWSPVVTIHASHSSCGAPSRRRIADTHEKDKTKSEERRTRERFLTAWSSKVRC